MPILNRRVPKSPRHLALRHAKKRFGTPDEHARGFGGVVGKPEALAPGEERLYSYYKPSLVAGTYDVTTEQYISNGTHKALKLTAAQSFTVVAPQFALPVGAIHSQYPPEGHADVVETLPHVVLTDPHLPWERIATDKKQPDEGFNTIPWLALMVFTPEELQLPEDHPLLRNQTETKTVTLSLARLLEQSVSRVIPRSFLENNPDTEADFIFIEPGIFNELMTEYDPEILKEGAQDKCSVSRYKWLAHVRNINTLGMADSGEFEDEEGVFGVVVAHRAGPMDNEVAKPLIAHLVSIEYVAGTPWPLALDKRVALTSLYSWTYMSLPADSFSVGQAMVHLGDTMAMLRPPQPTIDRLLADNQTKWIGQRLNDGYTLAKYRTSTGEISAALYRGPFAPTTIEHKLKTMSFFGTELQVMDKQTGLMDLTYCIAWHVGRTQALGDQAFTAALGRLRTAIHREGLKLAQKEALKAENHPVVDLKDALGSLSRGIRTLNEISSGTSTRNVPGHAVRWVRDAAEPLDVSFASPAVSTRFKAAANTVMAELSSSKDGNVYNEINAHNFPDWPIVMSWVLDRMYLGNLPSQYIVPDPTHLPRESLRFFHIDPNWVEALIDGGLAVANQVEKDDDKIRACIKDAITKYLQTPMGEGPGAYLPQVPTHGFLMRSELVTKYPDLILEAPFTDTSEEEMELKPASILRQENLDSTVLLALFDRVPGSPDFKTLIFRQPPHQQSFAAAFQLTPSQMYLQFRRVYTGPTTDPPKEKKLNINSDPYPMNNPLVKPGDNPPFIWGPDNSIRTLKFPDFANLTYDTLATKFKKGFDKEVQQKPTSALMGIQLNNPMLYLEICDKKRPPLETSSMRSLLMLDPATTPVDTATSAPRILHAGKMFDLTSSLPSLSLPRATGEPAPPPPRLVGAITEEEYSLITKPPPGPPPSAGDGGEQSRSLGRERLFFAPAGYPKISYSCYGFGTYARASTTVPMWPNPPALRQDLIFRIQIDPDSISDFNLYELQIEIRLGPMGGQRKTLALNYDGPGARMLSNLRFNVIPVTSKDDNLLIRLLPRSTREAGVPLTMVKELSFVLNGVVVNRYPDKDLDKGCYKVYTVVTEMYGSRGYQVISDETSDHPFVIVMRKPEGSEYDIDAVYAGTGY
ncbi:hypothetical protein EV426DRAFT_311117 [Tirmania nivea]|nr:hypothetical protein EV426DRAFT_311117 [Tirmania nivea]